MSELTSSVGDVKTNDMLGLCYILVVHSDRTAWEDEHCDGGQLEHGHPENRAHDYPPLSRSVRDSI